MNKNLSDKIEQRSNKLSQIEIISYEISKLNRDIVYILMNDYGGRKFRFINDNKVVYANKFSPINVGVPHDIIYQLREVKSADNVLDIIFYFYPINHEDEENNRIIIRYDQFKSFEFIK